ncbi:acyl-CoA carboxylase subunit beta [Alphaproteobacteria bacterium]|nr:acyl-CoA carboxylase subunit beta [Alphaproteobacteria bacterium]MDC0131603.1 acyl-CoA carboxylase subunit beta [Alphaproteobacteria bacterium]
MPVFESKLNVNSEAFAKNKVDQLEKLAHMRMLEARAEAVSEKRRPRFEERGQLTPRDRLAQLLDPGLPYLPLYNMASYCVDDPDRETSIPGGSVLAGIGYVNGVRCMVCVDDSGINAGAATEMGFRKNLEVMRIALANKLPFIHLVESAGANLMTYKVELWAHGGSVFYTLAKLSAAGIPTMTVLHGPSTAGGAYMPGMSDYNVGVKHNGMAALGGAALVQAATGEIADERELGGSEMHSSVTGLIEYLAEDDRDGIRQIREVVGGIGWNEHCPPAPQRAFEPPLYAAEEILGLVPIDYKVPYDGRELIARLVDGSEFTDFKSRFGPNLVCVQAKIFGHPVGLVANNGPMGPNEAAKGAHFFQIIDQANIPLVFLNNITGYMVGTEYERAGMIKHGAKMIQAASNIRVPKLSYYVGASYGAGNYGMSGLGYEPDFLFSWPGAMTGVMSGESASGTMEAVALAGAKRRGVEPDLEALAKQKAAIEKIFGGQEDAFFTSGRLLDNGIIDPRDTRQVIGFTLETIWERKHRDLQPNAFGIGRM